MIVYLVSLSLFALTEESTLNIMFKKSPAAAAAAVVDDVRTLDEQQQAFLEQLTLIVTTTLVVLATTILLIKAWGKRSYESILNSPKTHCDIDEFCGDRAPPKYLKVALAHRFRLGFREANTEVAIPIEFTLSPHVKGLYVARNVRSANDADAGDDDVFSLEKLLGSKAVATPAAKSSDETPAASFSPPPKSLLNSPPRLGAALTSSAQKLNFSSAKELLQSALGKPTVVVGTIRMGFGHHRIAYSACSWALSMGYTTIFHDMLNIESEESELIQELDALYSKFSRLATEVGGPVEKVWGAAMKQGDADALRIAALTAAHLQPLLLAYPKDIPLITTHQLVALVAAAAGFTNVVNLVVDNYPQWFLVVPKTLNLVQGPINYQQFLKMGVRPDELACAGHWNPAEMVQNLEMDCSRRIQRAHAGFGPASQKRTNARRILVPVGGAGAQRTFILTLIKAMKEKIEEGRVQLFLNAGGKTRREPSIAMHCRRNFYGFPCRIGHFTLLNSLISLSFISYGIDTKYLRSRTYEGCF